NDVVSYLQKSLIELAQSKPPKNACRAFISISIGNNERNVTDGLDLYWKENFNIIQSNEFYFQEMKKHLQKSFLHYDMGGGQGKETQNQHTWAYRVGAVSKTFIAAYDVETMGKGISKSKSFFDNTQCSMAIHITQEWVISKEENDMRGFVYELKEDQKEKLKKGKLLFTRLGPNNGEKSSFEAIVEKGHYVTNPIMPSGHYKVELVEPTSCKRVLENNWLFRSGIDQSKSFEVACSHCNWKVEIEGNYTLCSVAGVCQEAKGSATWDELPIALEKGCVEEFPKPQVIADSPFDALQLLPPLAPSSTHGDFMQDDALFLSIIEAKAKSSMATPAHIDLSNHPIMVDFNAHSKVLKSLDRDEELSVGAIHQCFIAPQMGLKMGECKIKDIYTKLKEREAFEFTVDETNPFNPKEKSHFRFRFTPL
ncbi:MAG: hypothetical protein U9N49_01360, partial [Campylobacterota bacterium]|nr:hypothetical protein [Campylobacterota bacterium]